MRPIDREGGGGIAHRGRNLISTINLFFFVLIILHSSSNINCIEILGCIFILSSFTTGHFLCVLSKEIGYFKIYFLAQLLAINRFL